MQIVCEHFVEKEGSEEVKLVITSPEQEVEKEFLDFVQMVSDRENLSDWKLTLWDIKGNGECHPDMKLIYITAEFDVETTKAWFLHEVAHATFDMAGGSLDDSIWHRKTWRKEFDRLLKCYIPNISQRMLLWLDGIEARDEHRTKKVI